MPQPFSGSVALALALSLCIASISCEAVQLAAAPASGSRSLWSAAEAQAVPPALLSAAPKVRHFFDAPGSFWRGMDPTLKLLYLAGQPGTPSITAILEGNGSLRQDAEKWAALLNRVMEGSAVLFVSRPVLREAALKLFPAEGDELMEIWTAAARRFIQNRTTPEDDIMAEKVNLRVVENQWYLVDGFGKVKVLKLAANPATRKLQAHVGILKTGKTAWLTLSEHKFKGAPTPFPEPAFQILEPAANLKSQEPAEDAVLLPTESPTEAFVPDVFVHLPPEQFAAALRSQEMKLAHIEGIEALRQSLKPQTFGDLLNAYLELPLTLYSDDAYEKLEKAGKAWNIHLPSQHQRMLTAAIPDRRIEYIAYPILWHRKPQPPEKSSPPALPDPTPSGESRIFYLPGKLATSSEAKEYRIFQFLTYFNLWDPLRLFSTEDIRENAGLLQESDTATYRHISRLAHIIQSLRVGGSTYFRLPPPFAIRRANGLSLVWRGLSRDEIAHSRDFSRWREERWMGSAQHLLTVYEWLQTHPGAHNAEAIMSAIPVDAQWNSAALERGLHWLDKQGFPLRRNGREWTVDGFAARRFFSVDPLGWSRWQALQWRQLGRHATAKEEVLRLAQIQSRDSPREMADRMRLILDANEIPMGEASSNTRGRLSMWASLKDEPLKNEPDVVLSGWKEEFGIEPVWIRTGFSRSELEDAALELLPTLSLGERIVLFRRLAGLSRQELAQRLGVTMDSIFHLEKGTIETFKNKNSAGWAGLADILGVDVYLLVAGRPRDLALAALPTPQDRIDLIRRVAQKGAAAVTQAVPGWTVNLSTYERGLQPPLGSLERLADALGGTFEEIFYFSPSAPITEKTLRISRQSAAAAEHFMAAMAKDADLLKAFEDGTLNTNHYSDRMHLPMDVSRRNIRELIAEAFIEPAHKSRREGIFYRFTSKGKEFFANYVSPEIETAPSVPGVNLTERFERLLPHTQLHLFGADPLVHNYVMAPMIEQIEKAKETIVKTRKIPKPSYVLSFSEEDWIRQAIREALKNPHLQFLSEAIRSLKQRENSAGERLYEAFMTHMTLHYESKISITWAGLIEDEQHRSRRSIKKAV